MISDISELLIEKNSNDTNKNSVQSTNILEKYFSNEECSSEIKSINIKHSSNAIKDLRDEIIHFKTNFSNLNETLKVYFFDLDFTLCKLPLCSHTEGIASFDIPSMSKDELYLSFDGEERVKMLKM